MKLLGKYGFIGIILLLTVGFGHAKSQTSKWLQLDSDARERLRALIQEDVESRTGFSTPEEDELNTSIVREERDKEAAAYKAAIDAANSEYQRAKKRLDDLTAQFQTASYDFEETKKNMDTMRTGITNIDNSIARYQDDIRSQKEALSKWLKTTKQGEVIVAIIYTRGFMDSAHKLERQADDASAPLMARHMGTYIESFTKVVNNVLTGDFIKAVEEGTAKWNREEPIRIALSQGAPGTTYLRIKRYELYPFQSPEGGSAAVGGVSKDIKAAIITSKKDLDSFLSQSDYVSSSFDLSVVEGMIRDVASINQQADANQREQLLSFRERITYLEEKISSAQSDRASLAALLTDKETQFSKMTSELEVIRLKKESAELSFQNAQNILYEKKRVHESIIIKTSLVAVKRSETPAEASADAILEELKGVYNDARMEHYSSTTEVVDGKLLDESEHHAITEAKILAVRSLAFINEGDNIRVKMAFRVRTVLNPKEESGGASATSSASKLSASKDQSAARIKPEQTSEQKTAAKKESASAKPAKQKTAAPPSAESKQTLAAVDVTPALPKADGKSLHSASALNFNFTLNKVERTGKELTIQVWATNKADYTQYLAFFDESSSYARTTISDKGDKQVEVNQVYLIQGSKKIPAADAYRGIPIEPTNTVIVQFVFRDASPDSTLISKLNLMPTVGTRSFIRTYRWYTEEVTLKNISVPLK